MVHQFDHRWATYDHEGRDSRNLTSTEKDDPSFEPVPRYWVPQAEVTARLSALSWRKRWLLGWRDITNTTNERTLIANVIPAVASGDKFLLMFPAGDAPTTAGLLSALNSLVLDFVARQKLGGTSFKLYLIRQVPLLPPSYHSPDRLAFLVPRVIELTCTSHAITPFARDLGYDGPPFDWDEDRRANLRAKLDAFYARAYGLTRDELRYVLDPADVKGTDYPSETFRGLKTNEIRRHGEYRTARLVLAAWDRFEGDGTFRQLDLA
jgi:hypothetical protein